MHVSDCYMQLHLTSTSCKTQTTKCFFPSTRLWSRIHTYIK